MEIPRNPLMKTKYITIHDLEVYKLARRLSALGWIIHQDLDWHDKKIMGDQFIEATDSFGANVVEGYARYHHLDKIKFMYNARGSLSEASDHWLELLKERDKIDQSRYDEYKEVAREASMKLQNFITAIYRVRDKHQNNEYR